MKASLIAIALLSMAAVADEDRLAIPGKYVKSGETVKCAAESGCIIMTPQQFEDMANAIFQKSKEILGCDRKGINQI